MARDAQTPAMTTTATRKNLNNAAKATNTMVPTINVPTKPRSHPARPKTNRKMGKSKSNNNNPKITRCPPFVCLRVHLLYRLCGQKTRDSAAKKRPPNSP